MTNYEAMRTMDKDELAEFLSSIMDGQKCPASEKFCDGQRCCADAILNWLNADLDDEPGETSDMIHHPDHYTWKGAECKKIIEIMTRRESDRAAGIKSKPTAFRITGTLREFPAFEPVNVWFQYPFHVPDEAGFLSMAMEEGSLADIQAKGREAGNLVKKAKKESRVVQVDTAYEALSIGDEPVTVKAMAEYFDVSERTVKSYIEQNGKYKCGEGKVYRNE